MVALNLKPLERISKNISVPSAFERFGASHAVGTLYGLLAVSNTNQLSDEPLSVRLIITYRGLNPVYTNGPSVDPLPV